MNAPEREIVPVDALLRTSERERGAAFEENARLLALLRRALELLADDPRLEVRTFIDQVEKKL